MLPTIIVHGGAEAIPPEKVEPMRAGCLAAVQAGWEVLENGGSALDAVEAAIRVMEDDGHFNAGFGSMLDPDGVVRMDAGIMEGRLLQAGGVGAIEGVPHPISVARKILDSDCVLIVGPHARRCAEEENLALCDGPALITDERRREWEERLDKFSPNVPGHDTVGCIALDGEGNLACGASTGGTGDKRPGRVGDSAQAGNGYYADNQAGAAVMTGAGEEIIRVTLARTLVILLGEGHHPNVAARKALDVLERRVQGKGGCIAVDQRGRIGWAHNEPNISVAYRTAAMEAPVAFVTKEEELRQLQT